MLPSPCALAMSDWPHIGFLRLLLRLISAGTSSSVGRVGWHPYSQPPPLQRQLDLAPLSLSPLPERQGQPLQLLGFQAYPQRGG
jgi:hypothetical protein